MFSLTCGLCRPQRQEAAAPPGGSNQDASQPPLAHPTPQILRSKSERRILQVVAEPLDRSQSMPAPSLLEASRRRLLAAQQQEEAAAAAQQAAVDSSTAREFVQQYMQAIRDSNARCVAGWRIDAPRAQPPPLTVLPCLADR